MKSKNGLFELPESVELLLPDQSLPSPDIISYYILENDRKIYLDGDVSLDTILPIQRMILRWNMEDIDKDPEERKPIIIYIFSYGGDMDAMWSFIDTIKLSETPIYTVNMGVAASAASLIFIAGHKRYMLPRSELIVHEGSAQIQGDAIKVFDNVDNYKEMVKKMKEFILANTSIPQSMLNKKRSNDWHIDSTYCIENNVCDKVVETLSEII